MNGAVQILLVVIGVSLCIVGMAMDWPIVEYGGGLILMIQLFCYSRMR